jgi:putative CocE/NonD family hydrolase
VKPLPPRVVPSQIARARRVATEGLCLTGLLLAAGRGNTSDISVERDLAVPMRDGVILRADLYRPATGDRFPVLVYRTPYGKHDTAPWNDTHLAAVARGYAVLMQDVRGRYASAGDFYPYIHEGKDGFDTIEWAAKQSWSNGHVGTYGLSYPGAVQWLAALESPPHLEAMVPAMTYATPTRFFYFNGVFDLSWIAWIHNNIAPDTRVRRGLVGPKTGDEARAAWSHAGDRMRRQLPLESMIELEEVAPYYYDWLQHPPADPWWDWAELEGRYDRVEAAVLNLSGWYDEAYGPDGATTNFLELVRVRADAESPRTRLVLGPWVHGVASVAQTRVGDLDFGPAAALDYNAVVLDWMDRYVRGIDNGVDSQPPVRYFLMGENRWHEAESWPPESVETLDLFLVGGASPAEHGSLRRRPATQGSNATTFVSNPAEPVSDPYAEFGPHDYAALADRRDLAVFDSDPLPADLMVVGAMEAEIYLSCNCKDLDLWVKVLDVTPEGAAFNLMSPGLDVQRASYREPKKGRQPLEPGSIYKLELPHLITGTLFRRGHRIRVQISGSFFPHFSRNLQTGASETESSEMRPATIEIHHDETYASRLLIPVVRQ